MGEVEVVAKQVEALAERLKNVEDVLEEDVDYVVETLANSEAQRTVARLER